MNDISKILQRRIDQALSREKADLVLKGGRVLDIAQGDLVVSDIAICGDRIVGTHEKYDGRKEIDARGLVIVPGFIDTHVHIESSCITPWQFDRCVLPRGTTTAICDPHEIANVLGVPGLQYFLDASTNLVMDLKVQLSSCVPASHLETSGARLLAGDLVPLRDHPSVIQVILQATLAAPVTRDKRQISNDQAAGVNARRLFVFIIDPGVADMRIGQRDQLLAIGRVSKDFLVTGHRSVENNFAG